MWKFKSFMPKEQTGLEGRTIDVKSFKVHVCNAIAEGGFSCVYLARDVSNGSKQYALKHIICNDNESLELVMKEISVMNSLKGHPNVVTLHAHSVFDMGRTKEAILVMEYCEKSLVSALESRGSAYFEEKQILTLFRDVCNAVFAMHCQSPPIAHRDLKAENLLLGSDGSWKLCDFGSTSTNHKRFEKPEEMGVEEDNIRKHTTPAYRAPEMWDLYRRDLISEKVDIWALGCLLYRICYFKSAFDGESKLQVLNGNYRVPELPKYSTYITELIRDMLQSSPEARPDITQVWFRVNGLLPDLLQKSLPDQPPGCSKSGSKSNPMPRRSAPPPPSAAESARQVASALQKPRAAGSSGPAGAFWTTQHAQDSAGSGEKARPKFDEGLTTNPAVRHDGGRSDRNPASLRTSPSKVETPLPQSVQKNVPGKSADGRAKDFEINFFPEDMSHGTDRPKALKVESKPANQNQNDAFNAFAAEFVSSKLSPGPASNIRKEASLEAEVDKLKEQLGQVNMEKAEVTSKYEKLSAICRSQRQEIQELKQALAARTPSPSKDPSKSQASPCSQPSSTPQQREKVEGTVWELQQGLFNQGTTSPDPKPWQAFADDPKPPATSKNDLPKTGRTRNGHQSRQEVEVNPGSSTWGFGSDDFRAVPNASPQVNLQGGGLGNIQRLGETRDSMPASQPAGWAGF